MIEGRVAAILTRRELVLNVGTADGVSKGMKFAVLNEHGLEIVDPQTGEPLGSVALPKVILEIARVDDHLSIGRTYRKTTVNVGGILPGVSNIFQPTRWVEDYESLRLADKPSAEAVSEDESYVKIGDIARQVIGNEYQ